MSCYKGFDGFFSVERDLFEFVEKIPTFEPEFDTKTIFHRTVIPYGIYFNSEGLESSSAVKSWTTHRFKYYNRYSNEK